MMTMALSSSLPSSSLEEENDETTMRNFLRALSSSWSRDEVNPRCKAEVSTSPGGSGGGGGGGGGGGFGNSSISGEGRVGTFLRGSPSRELSSFFFQGEISDDQLRVPGLSLRSLVTQEEDEGKKRQSRRDHQQDDDRRHAVADRSNAEKQASSNLARWLFIPPSSSSSSSAPSSASAKKGIVDVPNELLLNMEDSFGLLMNARLRAYVTILARHGVALAESPCLTLEEQETGILAVERKVGLLLEVASRVHSEEISTSFSLVGQSTNAARSNVSSNINDHHDGPYSCHRATLKLDSHMRVCIPAISETNNDNAAATTTAATPPPPRRGRRRRRLPDSSDFTTIDIRARADGDMTAFLDVETNKIISVQINLEMHDFLESLVQGAAEVTSIALEGVKSICNISASLTSSLEKLKVSTASPLLPPPPPAGPNCNETQEDRHVSPLVSKGSAEQNGHNDGDNDDDDDDHARMERSKDIAAAKLMMMLQQHRPASDLPIVSPDLGSIGPPCGEGNPQEVPPLSLDVAVDHDDDDANKSMDDTADDRIETSEEAVEDDCCQLSIEKCASIVDRVLLGGGDYGNHANANDDDEGGGIHVPPLRKMPRLF